MRQKLALLAASMLLVPASAQAGQASLSGFGDIKQIQVQIVGPDSRELQKVADRVITLVRETPGAVDVGHRCEV